MVRAKGNQWCMQMNWMNCKRLIYSNRKQIKHNKKQKQPQKCVNELLIGGERNRREEVECPTHFRSSVKESRAEDESGDYTSSLLPLTPALPYTKAPKGGRGRVPAATLRCVASCFYEWNKFAKRLLKRKTQFVWRLKCNLFTLFCFIFVIGCLAVGFWLALTMRHFWPVTVCSSFCTFALC